MRQYSVEAWSLSSSAANHRDRILTGTAIVGADRPEDAVVAGANALGIPSDYWKGTRAASVGVVTALRRGAEVTVGHAPYVILRVTEVHARSSSREPFNHPHMRGA